MDPNSRCADDILRSDGVTVPGGTPFSDTWVSMGIWDETMIFREPTPDIGALETAVTVGSHCLPAHRSFALDGEEGATASPGRFVVPGPCLSGCAVIDAGASGSCTPR